MTLTTVPAGRELQRLVSNRRICARKWIFYEADATVSSSGVWCHALCKIGAARPPGLVRVIDVWMSDS